MALVIALSTVAVPVGMGLGGVLGDRWRGSLPLVVVGSGVAIALLAGVSSVLRRFGSVFEQGCGGIPRLETELGDVLAGDIRQ